MLKACPICNAKRHGVIRRQKESQLYCKSCGFIAVGTNLTEAKKMWNKEYNTTIRALLKIGTTVIIGVLLWNIM